MLLAAVAVDVDGEVHPVAVDVGASVVVDAEGLVEVDEEVLADVAGEAVAALVVDAGADFREEEVVAVAEGGEVSAAHKVPCLSVYVDTHLILQGRSRYSSEGIWGFT